MTPFVACDMTWVMWHSRGIHHVTLRRHELCPSLESRHTHEWLIPYQHEKQSNRDLVRSNVSWLILYVGHDSLIRDMTHYTRDIESNHEHHEFVRSKVSWLILYVRNETFVYLKRRAHKTPRSETWLIRKCLFVYSTWFLIPVENFVGHFELGLDVVERERERQIERKEKIQREFERERDRKRKRARAM